MQPLSLEFRRRSFGGSARTLFQRFSLRHFFYCAILVGLLAACGLLVLLSGVLTPTTSQTPQRVTFISVNDVYKLVSLPHELPYFYLKADLDYIAKVTTENCDGWTCGGSDLSNCGRGGLWEACFPSKFVVQELSVKTRGHDGPRAIKGPCHPHGSSSAADFETSGTGEEFGGLVDFAATYKWLKDEAAAAGDLAIGTLAGDFIAPSYLAEIFKGKQLVEVMNHMGVDLVDIGNHDVDFGLDTLMGQMDKSAFHYLNSNLKDLNGTEIQQPMLGANKIKGNDFTHKVSDWRRLELFGRGWAVLDKAGVKVCVLGNTDIDKMNWRGKKVLSFERDIPAAIAIMKQWETGDVGCTLRIAMTHTRTGNDLNLFRAVEAAGLHLDAIIAGHDHYAAFAELKRNDGGITYMIKAGSDARLITKLSFDVSGEQPVGTLELVPVVAGACRKQAGAERKAWFQKAENLFTSYVSPADEANKIALNVLYRGVYDTSSVRDAETRAVNTWLDLMRRSLGGDVLFFQAGLVRQDMNQDFGRDGLELSKLFMLEEFPWGDLDKDARSSIFPFKIKIRDLVMYTVPFLARRYWCNAPFNDANRIHTSGLMIEMSNDADCERMVIPDLVKSIVFVGNCHQAGALQNVDSSCCTSPICGKIWTNGHWSTHMTNEMQEHELVVLTGQFCVPSKYGSHGRGFHDAGMICRGAEAPENWASGTDVAQNFKGVGVIEPSPTYIKYAAPDFQKHGYFLKQALEALLKGSAGPPPGPAPPPQGGVVEGKVERERRSLVVGDETLEECKQAQRWYESPSFYNHCACELGAEDIGKCKTPSRSNPFPRFFATAGSTSLHREL